MPFEFCLWWTVFWNLFFDIKKEYLESDRNYSEDQQVTID